MIFRNFENSLFKKSMSKWSVNKFTPLCRICEWKDSRVEEKPPSGGGGTCGGVGAAGEGLVLGMALNGHAGFPHHVASYITIILQYNHKNVMIYSAGLARQFSW